MPPAYSKITIILSIMLSALPLAAGVRGNFLSHGPSCVALSRGDTGVSLYAGPGSAFYNPALLSSIGYGEAELSHFTLYEGSRYNFGSFACPVTPELRAGFSAINLASGDIELRRTLTDVPSTSRANQWALLFSAARHFSCIQGLDAGLSIKYLSFNMAGHTGSGIGMDAGAAANFHGPAIFEETSILRAGISLQNLIAPAITMVSEQETYPLTAIAGGSLSIPVIHRFEGQDTIDIFSEISNSDGECVFHEGAEYSFAGRYALRAGMYGAHITAGGGCNISDFSIDYAMDFNDLALFHRFSLRYRWNTNNAPKQKKSARKGSLLFEARKAMTESNNEILLREQESKPLFKQALKEYHCSRFLNAIDLFGKLIMKYPEIESGHLYYRRINDEMSRDAQSPYESNLEKGSYARGYMSYREQKFSDSLREWEKVLQIDPERIELNKYISEARVRIKDQERIEREKNNLSSATALYDRGTAAFAAGNYISCIKTMERLQVLCSSCSFAKTAEYYSKATTHIERSIKALALSIKKRPAHVRHTDAFEKPVETDIDETGSDKRYREGLILYAQGKTGEAERMWEIALRLNPGNEKARRALEKVRQKTPAAR